MNKNNEKEVSLFTPNTDFFSNYYDKARYLLAWRISVSFLMIFSILSIIYSFANNKVLLMALLTLSVTTLTLLYLWKTKNYKPLFWIYAISGTILAHTAVNYVLDYTHYVDFLWMVACILTAFVGLGKKNGLIFLFVNSLGIVFFFFYSLNKHIITLQPKTTLEIIGDLIEIGLAMFVIGYLLHLYMDFNDYSEKQLKKANKELEEQNKLIRLKNEENITLVKEIHHRVKNNLQIIISLLRLQKGGMPAEYEKKFDEAIGRIMAMSLIHQKLYQETELSKLKVETYIYELVAEIQRVFEIENKVTINIESKIENIGLKTVVSFGLIINELVSNSFKHAFIESSNAKINIIVKPKENNRFELKYSDNGIWKEPTENCSCFGLELIETLAEQLEGTVTRKESTNIFDLKNLDI